MHLQKIFIVSIIGVFLLCLGTRIFYSEQKQALHADEAMTLNNIHNSPVKFAQHFSQGKEYKGQDLKELYLFTHDSFSELKKDLSTLYQNNANYHDHTNLYSILLRISMFGQNTYNLNNYITIGTYFNILFFCISFFLMFVLLKNLFPSPKNHILIPFTLLLAFMNTGSLSITCFIRPYQLAQTIFILTSLCFVYALQYINQDKEIKSISAVIIGTVCTSLCLLSGYMSVLFLSILYLILFIESILREQKKTFLFLLLIGVCSVELTLLLYPAYPNILNSQTISHHIKQTMDLSDVLIQYIDKYIDIVLSFIFYPISILLLLFTLYIKLYTKQYKGFSSKITFILFFSAFLFCSISLLAAPYKELRYLSPAIPLLFLIFPALLANMQASFTKIIAVILSILYIFYAFHTNSSNLEKTTNYITNSKFENLFLKKGESFKVITAQPKIPVILYRLKYMNQIANIIPYISDKQTYVFTNHIDINDWQQAFLIIPNQESLNDIPPAFNIQKKISMDKFTVYLLNKKQIL